MNDAIKIFIGLVIGFGLYEGANALLGDGEIAYTRLALDILGPALIATVIIVLYERYRARRRAERE